MNVPADLRYTAAHEWARAESDGTVTVGITDHAQAQLGDLVYLELPEVGRKVAAEEACAVVESVKAASDVYAPLAGEVVAVNDGARRCTRAGEQGRLRGVVLQAEARRRRRLREAARRQGVRGRDRRPNDALGATAFRAPTISQVRTMPMNDSRQARAPTPRRRSRRSRIATPSSRATSARRPPIRPRCSPCSD